MSTALQSTQDIYNRVASRVRDWHWHSFWECHEYPLLIDWAHRNPGNTLLDAGCGTGDLLLALAAHFDRLIGVDFSGGMLDIARKTTAPFAAKVTLMLDDIAVLNLADASVSNAICARVLSLIPNINQPLAELYRVCDAGAALCISDIHPQHPYSQTRIAIDEHEYWLETYKRSLAEVIGAVQSAGFVGIVLREFSLQDLQPKPDPVRYSKLYAAGNPKVFYLLEARKPT